MRPILALPYSLLLATSLLVLLLACGGDQAPAPTFTPVIPTSTFSGSGDSAPTATPAPSTGLTFAPSPGVAGDAALGEQAFQSYGCNACHSTDGATLVGPTWQGLYGTEEELEGGGSALVDDDYVIESIKDPNARITAGFTAGLMPTQETLGLSDDDILHIIEYMKTLR